MSCAICETRKEKRFCLSLHRRICPQCCGQQREVTLDCPSQCPYLQQAREHEKPRSADELKDVELFLNLEVDDHFLYEREHLLLGLTYALAKSAGSDPSLNDRDLIAVVTSMTKTYQTLVNSGLHYQTPTASISQQAIATQIEAMLEEYRETEHKNMGYSSLRDSDILKALVFLVRMAHGKTSGRLKSRAFIDFLGAQFPPKKSLIATGEEVGSRIITS